MDVIGHTLWTNALFYTKYAQQRRMRYLAAFFGVVPDLIGFIPLFVYLIATGNFGRNWNRVQDHWTAQFAIHTYNYTHSLVIFSGFLVLVTILGNLYFYYKNSTDYKFWFFWPMLGWGLHILIDIPTHPDIYRTPLLFPISDFRFPGGVSWAHPMFMLVNYSLLASVYVCLAYYQKRNREKKIQP